MCDRLKCHIDPQPRRRIRELQFGAMKVRDGCDQRQTQSVALRGAAGRAAIEAAGYFFEIIRGYAGAIINDRRDRFTLHGLQDDADVRARGSMANRVLDQIAE